MILANSAEDPACEREILQTLGRGVDGVIPCSPRLSSEIIQAALGSTPLVVINGETDCAPSVLMDEILLDQIAGRPAPDQAVHLAPRLIVRGFTSGARSPSSTKISA